MNAASLLVVAAAAHDPKLPHAIMTMLLVNDQIGFILSLLEKHNKTWSVPTRVPSALWLRFCRLCSNKNICLL
jgi:hypothetical protein